MFLKLGYVLVSVLTVYSCGGAGGFKSMSALQSDLNLPKLPSQENYPEHDAVVLLDESVINLQISPDYELYTIETRHVAKKLFKNIEDEASVEIYLSFGEELQSIKARTVKKDGITVPLKETDFYKIVGEGEGSVFYSDVKRVRFTFPSIEKDCIVEYEYVVKNDRPFFQDEWRIQSYLPIIKNRFRLELPTILLTPVVSGGLGWNWRYMAYQKFIGEPKVDSPLNPEGSIRTKKSIFTWEVDNIAPLEPEYAMPSHADYMARVRFARSEWETWSDVTRWYYAGLFLPQLTLTPTIKKTAQELTVSCKTEEEKIEKIFRYVQQCRYVAIALGVGGIQPNTPETVLSRQYGDCKDKSILLISLLKSIGIEATPVLVKTKSRGRIDGNFPTWDFNHMIAKAKTSTGKVFWLDATASFCPLGEIPYECEGVRALVMFSDSTSTLETIPTSTEEQNAINVGIEATLSENSQAEFKVRLTYKGEFGLVKRYQFSEKTEKEMAAYCKELVSEKFPNATVRTYSIINLDSVNQPLTLDVAYAVENAVQTQGDLNMLNIDPFQLLNDSRWLKSEKRNYPVQVQHPYSINKTIRVSFAPKYAVRNLPENVSFATSEMAYAKQFEKQSETQFSATEKFVWKAIEISPEMYPEVKRLYESVQSKREEKVILTRK